MVKHTQTIRRQKPTKCLSVFGHSVGLALKGLMIVLIVVWFLGTYTQKGLIDINISIGIPHTLKV